MPRISSKAHNVWRPLDEYTPFARKIVDYMRVQWPPVSVEDIASHLNVRNATVYFWLSDDNLPNYARLPGIAEMLGIPLDELQQAYQDSTKRRSSFASHIRSAIVFVKRSNLPPDAKSSITDKLNEILSEYQQNRQKTN